MMAVVRRTLYLAAVAAVACSVALSGSQVVAQPLVTGGLVTYYDFDNFTNTVTDGSGNGFNGKVQDTTRNILDQPFTLNTTGVISNETVDTEARWRRDSIYAVTGRRRGSGFHRYGWRRDFRYGGWNRRSSNRFTYGDEPNFNGRLGKRDELCGDFTVFNGASGGHGVPHFQIQGSGQIRFTIRNAAGQNLVDSGGAGTSGGLPQSGHPYPNQVAVTGSGATATPWPINEWHHVAIAYDYNTDFDGAGPLTGHLDMFYDGVKIKSMGFTPAGPAPIGPWQLRAFSDYYDGLAIGAVYDSGSRRTQGLMDEAYLFNRKLTDAEVFTLYNMAPPGVAGDYNGDGTVDAADYVLWRNGGPARQ